MNLAIETYALRKHYGDEAAFRMIKDAGFDGVDYSYYWLTEQDTVLGDDYIDQAHAIRRLLDGAGLVCRQCHAPFDAIHHTVWDESDPFYLSIVRSLESARILGADHIVVHCPYPSDDPTIDGMDENIRYFHAMEPFARRAGIKIAIENLFSNVTRLPDGHRTLCEALDPAVFVPLVDVGHAFRTGLQPAEYLHRFQPLCPAGLHVQDNMGVGDDHLIPGLGKIDWDALAAALVEIGYTGDVTLEVLGFLRPFVGVCPNELLKVAYASARMVADKIETKR